MNEEKNMLHTLNERLIASFGQEAPLGLADGKTGFCLFAFWLSRREKNKQYQKVAEELLDDVFGKAAGIKAIDLANGLAGIGLAVRYLIKEYYVKGDPNTILGDVDNVIFKYLSYPTHLDNISIRSVIQALFYLCMRLNDQKKGSEQESLYQELIIAMVNHIYQKTDASFFEEPMPLSINYLLPKFLFLLSCIHQSGFYNHRITKILEEIGLKTLSTIPVLHANRLYLMWGVDSVIRQVNLKGWSNHIALLKNNLDVETILDEELRNRNIFIHDGFSGIYLLLNALQGYFSQTEMRQWVGKIIGKIEHSDIWALIKEEPKYFMQNRGLVSGFCGVSMVLSDAKSKYICA